MDPPEFRSLKAPGNKESFKELMQLFPPEIAKKNRAAIAKICYKCEKDVDDLKKCSKCKSIWYCSVECQRADWPNHKQMCNSTESDNFVRLQKLTQNFMANPMLQMFIQQYCALAFGFAEPDACHPDKARHVIVDVGFEPVDITTFLSLPLLPDIPRPIRGMFQIMKITKVPESQSIREDKMVLWRRARQGSAASGLGDCPIILVEYRLRENMSTMTTTLPIQTPVLELVRERKPYECVSAIRGKFEKPMTENNVIEMLNMTIRQDKSGQLKLQVDLNESDIEIIRNFATANENSPAPRRNLLEKTRREDIYLMIMSDHPISARRM